MIKTSLSYQELVDLRIYLNAFWSFLDSGSIFWKDSLNLFDLVIVVCRYARMSCSRIYRSILRCNYEIGFPIINLVGNVVEQESGDDQIIHPSQIVRNILESTAL
jgi:hypothetical protein